MTTLEKYTNVFVENLQITAEQCEGLQYQGVELWDSVGHMTLVAALEDTFDIMLETDDIVDLSSFEKGMEILQKYDITFYQIVPQKLKKKSESWMECNPQW